MDIKFAIVTCSDTRTIEQDEAGSALVGLIEGAGWHVVSHVVACDDARDISDAIRAATDEEATAQYLRCEEILAETAANVYIQDLADLVAVRKGLSGYRFYPLYAIDLSTVAYT